MSNNNQTNSLIKWLVSGGDFLLLNAVLWMFHAQHWRMASWSMGRADVFLLVCNMALLVSMAKFSTIIHQRMVSAGDILKRVIQLTMLWAILTFLLLKLVDYDLPIGWLILEVGSVFAVLIPNRSLENRD